MKKLLYGYSAVIALIIALGALSSCQKTNDNISGTNRPVVEAYLVPGTKTLVKVYYQKFLDDTITYGYPITGLKLNLSDGTNTVQLAENTPGNYSWNDVNFIKDKKTYTLNFTYMGKTVSATTTVPDKPTDFRCTDTLQRVPYRSGGFGQSSGPIFNPVTFSWDNPASWFYLMVYKDIDINMVPTNANSNRPYHDTETLLGQTALFQTQLGLFSFTGKYQVLLFHINKEYNDAISAGGGTSLSLTTPSTNVTNGLGIFTSMQADTVILDVKLQ